MADECVAVVGGLRAPVAAGSSVSQVCGHLLCISL